MPHPDSTKDVISSLPEEDQAAIAALTLSHLKTRSRLERLAAGSIWTKLGWALPIIVSMVFLGTGIELSVLPPIIIIFLLFLIQAEAAYVHSRIDAIYRLMKQDKDTFDARLTQAEQNIGRSLSHSQNSTSSGGGSED